MVSDDSRAGKVRMTLGCVEDASEDLRPPGATRGDKEAAVNGARRHEVRDMVFMRIGPQRGDAAGHDHATVDIHSVAARLYREVAALLTSRYLQPTA